MKNLFLVFISVVFTQTGFSQAMPIDKETGLITYTEVVKSDGATAKALYKAAKLWDINVYCRDKTFMQVSDDEDMTLVLKPAVPIYSDADGISVQGYVRYTLKIECRDGRYKYTFTDFRHEKLPATNECDGGALEKQDYECSTLILNKKKFWSDIKGQTNGAVLDLIDNMKKSIAREIQKKKGDW